MADRPTWLDELERDGFVVVKGVVPQKDCEAFQKSAIEWLESFPHGFKRDNRITWTAEHLPYGHEKGLYTRYAVNQEDFVWKIRTQPGIISAFEKVWGTDDLIASFDGMNVSLPVNAENGRTDIPKSKAWPHIDQDPRKVHFFEMYQGIANLAENGPLDGGLVVMKGSHKMHERFFAENGGIKAEQDAGVGNNGYGYKPADHEWFSKNGAETVKVCAGPGDLILWDSRTVHWNCSPEGDRIRFATYVCFAPRAFADKATLARKLEVFEAFKGTTHWPHQNVIPADKAVGGVPTRPNGEIDPANRLRPIHEPEITPVVMRLVGVRA